jgi:hypothetical protein
MREQVDEVEQDDKVRFFCFATARHPQTKQTWPTSQS